MKRSDMILSYIQTFSEENGYAPTVRQIGEAVGLYSSSTVHGHIERLVEQGLLEKETRQSRTMRVAKDSQKVTVIQSEGHIPVVIGWQGRTYTLNN